MKLINGKLINGNDFFFTQKKSYYPVIFVVFINLLTACSSTQFFYTFVDKFIQDEVEYFIDLNEKDKVLLSQQISEMVSWHRTSMLPRYAIYLDEIAKTLEETYDEKVLVNTTLAKGRLLIEETVLGLTPYASKFLIRHQTPKDIEFIKKKMKKRKEERMEEFLQSNETLYEDRVDRLTSNFKRFFGTLNDEQVIHLKAHAQATLGDAKTRFENRTMRQKIFVKFLQTQPQESELTFYLNKLLLRGHLLTNPSYEAFSEGSLMRFETLLVKMIANSSIDQRKVLIRKLRDYSNDFKNLFLKNHNYKID